MIIDGERTKAPCYGDLGRRCTVTRTRIARGSVSGHRIRPPNGETTITRTKVGTIISWLPCIGTPFRLHRHPDTCFCWTPDYDGFPTTTYSVRVCIALGRDPWTMFVRR